MGKWISVKDRLPKEGGFYLVAVTDKVSKFTARYTDIARYENDFMPFWDYHKIKQQNGVVEITHWRKLPKPPKEE